MKEIQLTNNYDIEDFNAIKNRFLCRMKEYDINFEEKDLIALDTMVNALLNKDIDRTKYIVVINASPGLGKSVLIQEYINYFHEKDRRYGAIIAKERIEDIVSLQDKYTDKYYALYGFNVKDCLMGYESYNPNLCRICDRASCRVKLNSENAVTHPVITTTHKRIQFADIIPFLRTQLSEYTYFVNDKPVESRRDDLFIDESPLFYELEEISTIDIDTFIRELDNTYQRHCKNKEKVIEYFTELAAQLKEIMVSEPNKYFDGFVKEENYTKFTKFENLFRDNYYGQYFPTCMNIVSVLKYGGKNLGNRVLFPMFRALNRLPFNTTIFDGTSGIDENFPDFNCLMVRVPETRLFSNFTLNWNKNNNLSKNYYIEHPDFISNIISSIKDKLNEHNKILIVTFKDNKKIYEAHLKDEIEQGRIMLGHVNATKGKNEYSQCTAIYILYNVWKTDDYYLLAKRNQILDINPDDIMFDTHKRKRTPLHLSNDTDDKGNRLMKVYEPLNTYIVKDKSKDIIQELFRIKIRQYNFNGITEAFLYNTDPEVIEQIAEFFPNATIVDWKPFNNRKKSEQLEQYETAIKEEFENVKPMYAISLVDFRNKYHIKDKTFSTYQKNPSVQEIHNHYNVHRKGNFFVKGE